MTLKTFRVWVLALGALCALAPGAKVRAQQQPDAGTLLRQQPVPPQPAPAKPAPVKPSAPAASVPDGGPRILVKGFRISGATLIPEAELAAQLQEFVGQQLNFTQLQRAALLLVGYYADKGYLVRVLLPPQDVKDGIVGLRVIEGRRGEVRIDKKGERIDAARVRRFIDERLAAGEPMRLGSLAEAVEILNEQPGISVFSEVAQGRAEREVDVVLTADERPLFGFNLNASNHGSRGTGEGELGGSVTLSNPTGSFDFASVLVNGSEGSTFGRADYSLALGNRGLRAGAYASHLRYRLTQDAFAALGANGTARALGLTASYPLARRTEYRLDLSAAYERRELVDRTNAGETSNRRVNAASVGLGGFVTDTLLGGGTNLLGVSLHAGDSDQRNAAALAADATTRKVQGSFRKIEYNYGRIQPFTPALALNATLRGQIAGKNLDSSERFSLGGPRGVRAYPTGEGTGDAGVLLAVDLGWRLSPTLNGRLFFDHGSVQLNRTLWNNWNAANPTLPNRYDLTGWGVGVDWRVAQAAFVTASIATPIGSNPGRDASGNDADGRRMKTRAWLSAILNF